MKQLAAILLLCIFLFNIGGYRGVFFLFEKNANSKLIAAIDKDQFDTDQLITITVPLSLPYQNNWKNFERVDGEIMVDGKLYHYVQRKVVDGAMVLQCIPDENKMHIENAKDDFFRLAGDLINNNTTTKKSSNNNVAGFKNMVWDYDNINTGKPLSGHTGSGNNLYKQNNIAGLTRGIFLLPEQPPEITDSLL